jgi:hypothetical protein
VECGDGWSEASQRVQPPFSDVSLGLALAIARLSWPGQSLAKWQGTWGLGVDGKGPECFVRTSGLLCKKKLLTDCLPIKKVAQSNHSQIALQPVSVLAGLAGCT